MIQIGACGDKNILDFHGGKKIQPFGRVGGLAVR